LAASGLAISEAAAGLVREPGEELQELPRPESGN